MGTGLVSPWHIAILAVVLLLVFGPKRIPEIGRSLGHGLREFKDSISPKIAEDEPPSGPIVEVLPAPHEHDAA